MPGKARGRSEAEGGGHFAEFGVEGFAVSGDEGFPEEFVDGNLFFAAFFEGAFADVPAVEVESCQAVAQDARADGIEPAGDGFDEGAAACAVRAFDGAETAGVFKAGVRTFLAAVEQWRHEVAVGVHFEKAGLPYLFLSCGTHPAAVPGIVPLQFFRFFFQQRGAAVADDAAGAAADRVIAAEVLREHFRGDQDIPDLDDGGHVHDKKFCKIKQ